MKFTASCRKRTVRNTVVQQCDETFTGPEDIPRYVAHMRAHGLKYPVLTSTGKPMESTKQGLPPANSYRRYDLEAARLPDVQEQAA